MFKILSRFLLKVSLGILSSLVVSPVLAAEQITFNYPPFGEFYISIQDLETFALEGKITPSFAYYAQKVTPQELTKLRELLNKPFPVNADEVYNFFRTEIGQEVLAQVIKIINSPPDESKPALKGALITAAEDPKGLTIINVLRQYSLPNIRVNLPTVINTVNSADEFFNQTDRVFSWLDQQSVSQSSVKLPTPIEKLTQPGQVTWRQESVTVNRPNQEPIIAQVYIPNNLNKPAPVIVVAPGLNSDIGAFGYVAKHLASHGFGIIAIDFPQTDAQRIWQELAGLDTIPKPNAWLQQPLDVTSVLNAVELKVKSDAAWKGKLDLTNVGMLGQSLGGYTSLGIGGSQTAWSNVTKACQTLADPYQLTFNPALIWQCRGVNGIPPIENMQDERIKAVIAVNPVTNPIFDQQSMGSMKTPLMMISGSADIFAPAIPEQIRPFTWLTQSDKYLVLINNSTHLSFLEGTNDLPAIIVGPAPDLAHKYLQVLSLAFFNTYLNNQTEFKAYLEPSALSSISQKPLQMYILRSLTPDQLTEAIKTKN